MRYLSAIIALLMTALTMNGRCTAAAETAPKVYIIDIAGDVAPGMAAFVKRALDDIPRAEGTVIVFEMDTFGGQVDAALTIVDLIVETDKGQTIAFVTKKAISAGALIALSCDRLAMKPNTTIGDCAPIMIGGEGPEMLGEKFQSPLRAKFRSLAKKNGYAEVLAEAMVTAEMEVFRVVRDGKTVYMDAREFEELSEKEKAAVTEKKTVVAKGELLTMDDVEARDLGFSRLTADNAEEMLKNLGITGRDIIRVEQKWSEGLMRFIGTIAPLLMLIGLGAVYTEIKAPGFGAPGVIGIICLALFFMHQYTVGLADYTEMLIIALGFVLIGLEIFVLPGFGIAGIVGLICIITGLVLSLQGFVLPDPALPWQTELMTANLIQVFGSIILAFVLALVMLRYVLPRASAAGPYLDTTLRDSHADSLANTGVAIGDRGVAVTPLRPSGKMKTGTGVYDVVTQGDFLDRGTPVVITAVSGNRLIVTKEARE
ncbi:MAG: NfeD family protein [Thermodesulfobacteriota bacterium]